MKKQTALAAAFLCVATAYSQHISLTPEAGISAVQRYGWGQQWRPSAKIGVSADFALSERFSVESGLFYTFRGYKVNGGKYSNEHAEWTDNVSQTRHFLQLPVLAKYRWNLDEHTRLFVAAGPYVGVCLGTHFDSNPSYLSWGYDQGYGDLYDGDYQRPAGHDQNGHSNAWLYDEARRFDWGVTGGIGIESGRWVTRLQYDLSLGKESGGDPIGANYHTLTLSVGYKFQL